MDQYEQSKGNKWSGQWLNRNKEVERPTSFTCETCGKVCRSKGGLTIHQRKMHNVSKLKKSFSCKKCGSDFPQEANLLNHLKFSGECRQEVVRAKKYVAKRKECPYCHKEMAATNVSRHIKEACRGGEASFLRRRKPFKFMNAPKRKDLKRGMINRENDSRIFILFRFSIPKLLL